MMASVEHNEELRARVLASLNKVDNKIPNISMDIQDKIDSVCLEVEEGEVSSTLKSNDEGDNVNGMPYFYNFFYKRQIIPWNSPKQKEISLSSQEITRLSRARKL